MGEGRLSYCKRRCFRTCIFSRIWYEVQFCVYLNSRILEDVRYISIVDKYSRCTYFHGFSFPRNSRKYVKRELTYVYGILLVLKEIWPKMWNVTLFISLIWGIFLGGILFNLSCLALTICRKQHITYNTCSCGL